MCVPGLFCWARRAQVPVWVEAGEGAGTRRKPIHGGSMAPSMAPTVPRTHPDRPPTVFGHVQPRKRKKKTKSKSGLAGSLFVEPSPCSAAFRPVREAERGLGSTRASAARDPLLLFFILFRGLARTEIVSGRVGGGGGVSAAWMPRLSPHGWVHGVPANPTRPAHPQETRFQRPTQTRHGGAPSFADSRRRRAFHAEKKFPETCRFR